MKFIYLDFRPKSKWSEQAATILVAAQLSEQMLHKGCKRILLFVDGVEQARAISGHLRDKGINTSAIYGTLSSDERNSRINGFSSGHFQVLVSVNILREGIDVPLVDGILIMRRSLQQNSPMFTQIIGRGLRDLEGRHRGMPNMCSLVRLTVNYVSICPIQTQLNQSLPCAPYF